MNKDIDKIAFELWCGLDSVKDLEVWAVSELQKKDTHLDAYNLFRLDRDKAEEKALQIASETMQFNLDSHKCKVWAKNIFKKQCEIYLKGETKPYDFCKLVNHIDSLFLDDPNYPTWLGGIYYNCEWCDEKWTFQRDYHLAEEAERIVLLFNIEDEESKNT